MEHDMRTVMTTLEFVHQGNKKSCLKKKKNNIAYHCKIQVHWILKPFMNQRKKEENSIVFSGV